MPRFIVTHRVKAETQDEVFQGARRVVASLPEGVIWLNSWWVPETLKLLCEWDAPDPESVRQALAPVGDLFPIETIYEVEWADPKWYKPAGED